MQKDSMLIADDHRLTVYFISRDADDIPIVRKVGRLARLSWNDFERWCKVLEDKVLPCSVGIDYDPKHPTGHILNPQDIIALLPEKILIDNTDDYTAMSRDGSQTWTLTQVLKAIDDNAAIIG